MDAAEFVQNQEILLLQVQSAEKDLNGLKVNIHLSLKSDHGDEDRE